MLGAEVGTCADTYDTLVATIGRGRPALRTGVFHLVFNICCALIGIAFAPQSAGLAQTVSGPSVGRQIANTQLLFNLVGVVVVTGFLPTIARVLEKLLPDTEADRQRYRRQEKQREDKLEEESAQQAELVKSE